MPDVIVGAALSVAGLHRQRLLGPVQRLNLALFVDAEHDRLLGRVQIQADDIGDLRDQLGVGGELERLRPPRLHPVMPPGPQHRRRVHLQMLSEQPRRPMGDPELLRRRSQVAAKIMARSHCPRPSRPALIGQTLDTGGEVTLPPGDHRLPGRPDPPAISVFDTPSADSSTIRARWARPARIALDRVHDSNNSRSPGRRANGCARIPHSRAPTLSNYFRRAALGVVSGPCGMDVSCRRRADSEPVFAEISNHEPVGGPSIIRFMASGLHRWIPMGGAVGTLVFSHPPPVA